MLGTLVATLSIAMAPADAGALLIGVNGVGDASPAQDCQIVREALLDSGWDASQITLVAGDLTAQQVRSAVEQFGRGAEQSSRYEGFVFVSGQSVATGLAPVLTTQTEGVPLADLLGRLGKLQNSSIDVLLDTGHTNLLYGRVPTNVSVLAVQGSWRAVTTPRRVIDVVHNGRPMRVGVFSYIAAREIPFSRSMSEWSGRVGKYLDSGSMAAIWADLPRAQVLGDGNRPSP